MWIGKVKRRKHDGGGGKRFQSPRVPRSKGSKVQGSQGPRYLKVTFKYELDSKEGPSCSRTIKQKLCLDSEICHQIQPSAAV